MNGLSLLEAMSESLKEVKGYEVVYHVGGTLVIKNGETDERELYSKLRQKDLRTTVRHVVIDCTLPEDCSCLFKDYVCLGWLSIGPEFNSTKVRCLRKMFCGCTNLTSINLSHWDMSNVEDMSCMFAYCKSLEVFLALEESLADVYNKRHMFVGCVNLELPVWYNNIVNVKDAIRDIVNSEKTVDEKMSWIRRIIQPDFNDWSFDMYVEDGLNEGLNVALYLDPIYETGDMEAAYHLVKSGAYHNIPEEYREVCMMSGKVSQIRQCLDAISKGLFNPIIVEKDFDEVQMSYVNEGLLRGWDYSAYANPEFDEERMETITWCMFQGIDYSECLGSEYTYLEQKLITYGRVLGYDLSYFKNSEYTDNEKILIFLGMLQDQGIDTNYLEKVKITAKSVDNEEQLWCTLQESVKNKFSELGRHFSYLEQTDDYDEFGGNLKRIWSPWKV